MAADYSVSLSLQVQSALASLRALTAGFKKTDKAIDETDKALNEFEQELKQQSRAVKNTLNAQTAYVNKLKALQGGLSKTSRKYKLVTAELTKFEAKLNSSKGAVAGFGRSISGLLGPLGVALAGVAGLQKAFATISAQDFASAKVRTLGVDSAALNVELKKVTASLKGQASVVDLTAAAYDVASAGYANAADAAKILEASVNGAVGGFSDTNTVANAATSVLNAYGKSAADAERLVDGFIQTQNDGKIVVAEYAANIGKLAPIAASVGVEIEELNGAIASITSNGINAEIGITGLRSGIAKLSANSKEATDILKKYKVEINANTIASDGLLGTLKKLAKVTDQADVFKIVGVEAGQAIIPLINNLEKTERLIENQKDVAGVAKKAQEEAANTISGAWRAVGNSFSDLFADQSAAAESIVPILKSVANAIKAINSPAGQAALKLAAMATAIWGIQKAVIALKATAFIGWMTRLIPLLKAGKLGLIAMKVQTGLLTKATYALSTAMKTIPWVAAAAGLAYVGVEIFNAFQEAEKLENLLNGFDTDGINTEIKKLEKEIEDAKKEGASFIDMLSGFIFQVDFAAERVKGLEKNLNDLKYAQRIKLQLTTDLRPDQGGDLDMAAIRKTVERIEKEKQAAKKRGEEEDKKAAEKAAKEEERRLKGIADQKARDARQLADLERDLRFQLEEEVAEKRRRLIEANLDLEQSRLDEGQREIFGIIRGIGQDSTQERRDDLQRQLAKLEDAIKAMSGVIERASQGGPIPGTSKGSYREGGWGPSGPNAYGPHFDIKEQNGAWFSREALDKFVKVNGQPLSSGTTVPGGQFGAMRPGGREHRAWDYAFGGQGVMTLANGAKWMETSKTDWGDATAFMTPDGKVYRVIHGRFDPGSGGQQQTQTAATGMTAQSVGLEGERARMEAEAAAIRQQLNQLNQEASEINPVLDTTKVEEGINLIRDRVKAMKAENDMIQLRNELMEQGLEGAALDTQLQLAESQREQAQVMQVVNEAIAKQEKIIAGATAETEEFIEAQKKLEKLKMLAAGLTDQWKLLNEEISRGGQLAAQGEKGKIQTYMEGLEDSINDTEGQVVAMASSIESAVGGALNNIVNDLIKGNANIAESFSKMFIQIGQSFIQMATQMIAKALVLKALGVLFGGATGAATPAASAGAGVQGVAGSVASGFSQFLPSFSSPSSGSSAGSAAPVPITVEPFSAGPQPSTTQSFSTGFTTARENMLTSQQTFATEQITAAQDSMQSVGSGDGYGGGQINVSYDVQRINEVNYVSEEQMRESMKATIAQAEAEQLRMLRQVPTARRKAGIR